MKTKFYAVFDIEPAHNYEDNQKVLTKVAQFDTELEALQCIDNTDVGYQLTIMPVWE